MKVVYISDAVIPSLTANSIQVMKMCQAFKTIGHEIKLIIPNNPKFNKYDIPWSSRWDHYGIDKRFNIVPIDCKSEYEYQKNLIKLITSLKPDLVYSRNIFATFLMVILGFETICEIHSPRFHWLHKIIFPIIIRLNAFLSIVVISNALKSILLRENNHFFLYQKKIKVLHDGVDIERFHIEQDKNNLRKELNLNYNLSMVGYAGHLYKGRGINLIFDISKNLPNCKFIIIGGNQKDIQLRKKVMKEKRIKNIVFTGFIKNHDLPKYLAAMDILLMPYKNKVQISGGGGDTSKWMSPLKMFEYMASGTAVVSSDLPVLREVLSENNSILCDPNNKDQWIIAINKLLSDKLFKSNIEKNARRKVKLFDWTIRAEKALN